MRPLPSTVNNRKKGSANNVPAWKKSLIERQQLKAQQERHTPAWRKKLLDKKAEHVKAKTQEVPTWKKKIIEQKKKEREQEVKAMEQEFWSSGQDFSSFLPEELAPESTPESTSDKAQESTSDKDQERAPDRAQERAPDRAQERAPDRAQESAPSTEKGKWKPGDRLRKWGIIDTKKSSEDESKNKDAEGSVSSQSEWSEYESEIDMTNQESGSKAASWRLEPESNGMPTSKDGKTPWRPGKRIRKWKKKLQDRKADKNNGDGDEKDEESDDDLSADGDANDENELSSPTSADDDTPWRPGKRLQKWKKKLADRKKDRGDAAGDKGDSPSSKSKGNKSSNAKKEEKIDLSWLDELDSSDYDSDDDSTDSSDEESVVDKKTPAPEAKPVDRRAHWYKQYLDKKNEDEVSQIQFKLENLKDESDRLLQEMEANAVTSMDHIVINFDSSNDTLSLNDSENEESEESSSEEEDESDEEESSEYESSSDEYESSSEEEEDESEEFKPVSNDHWLGSKSLDTPSSKSKPAEANSGLFGHEKDLQALETKAMKEIELDQFHNLQALKKIKHKSEVDENTKDWKANNDSEDEKSIELNDSEEDDDSLTGNETGDMTIFSAKLNKSFEFRSLKSKEMDRRLESLEDGLKDKSSDSEKVDQLLLRDAPGRLGVKRNKSRLGAFRRQRQLSASRSQGNLEMLIPKKYEASKTQEPSAAPKTHTKDEMDSYLNACFQLLVQLSHALNCKLPEGTCHYSTCKKFKEILGHCTRCTNRRCPLKYCKSSQYVLRNAKRIKREYLEKTGNLNPPTQGPTTISGVFKAPVAAVPAPPKQNPSEAVLAGLKHASSCRAKGTCKFPECDSFKQLVFHLLTCSGSSCHYAPCQAAKFILQNSHDEDKVKKKKKSHVVTITTNPGTKENEPSPPNPVAEMKYCTPVMSKDDTNGEKAATPASETKDAKPEIQYSQPNASNHVTKEIKTSPSSSKTSSAKPPVLDSENSNTKPETNAQVRQVKSVPVQVVDGSVGSKEGGDLHQLDKKKEVQEKEKLEPKLSQEQEKVQLKPPQEKQTKELKPPKTKESIRQEKPLPGKENDKVLVDSMNAKGSDNTREVSITRKSIALPVHRKQSPPAALVRIKKRRASLTGIGRKSDPLRIVPTVELLGMVKSKWHRKPSHLVVRRQSVVLPIQHKHELPEERLVAQKRMSAPDLLPSTALRQMLKRNSSSRLSVGEDDEMDTSLNLHERQRASSVPSLSPEQPTKNAIAAALSVMSPEGDKKKKVDREKAAKTLLAPKSKSAETSNPLVQLGRSNSLAQLGRKERLQAYSPELEEKIVPRLTRAPPPHAKKTTPSQIHGNKMSKSVSAGRSKDHFASDSLVEMSIKATAGSRNQSNGMTETSKFKTTSPLASSQARTLKRTVSAGNESSILDMPSPPLVHDELSMDSSSDSHSNPFFPANHLRPTRSKEENSANDEEFFRDDPVVKLNRRKSLSSQRLVTSERVLGSSGVNRANGDLKASNKRMDSSERQVTASSRRSQSYGSLAHSEHSVGRGQFVRSKEREATRLPLFHDENSLDSSSGSLDLSFADQVEKASGQEKVSKPAFQSFPYDRRKALSDRRMAASERRLTTGERNLQSKDRKRGSSIRSASTSDMDSKHQKERARKAKSNEKSSKTDSVAMAENDKGKSTRRKNSNQESLSVSNDNAKSDTLEMSEQGKEAGKSRRRRSVANESASVSNNGTQSDSLAVSEHGTKGRRSRRRSVATESLSVSNHSTKSDPAAPSEQSKGRRTKRRSIAQPSVPASEDGAAAAATTTTTTTINTTTRSTSPQAATLEKSRSSSRMKEKTKSERRKKIETRSSMEKRAASSRRLGNTDKLKSNNDLMDSMASSERSTRSSKFSRRRLPENDSRMGSSERWSSSRRGKRDSSSNSRREDSLARQKNDVLSTRQRGGAVARTPSINMSERQGRRK